MTGTSKPILPRARTSPDQPGSTPLNTAISRLDALLLVEACPDPLLIVSDDGTIQVAGSRLERLFGYEPGTLAGAPLSTLIPERFHHSHNDHFQGYLDDPQPRAMAETANPEGRRRDGSSFPVEISLGRLQAADQTFVIAAVRDATRRSRIEDRFRRYIELAPDGIVFTDIDGRILLVNAQAEQIFGYPRAELVGQHVEILIPHDLRERHPHHRAGFVAGPRPRAMGSGLGLNALRKDGTPFPVEISLGALDSEVGTVISCVVRDVSERAKVDAARFHLAGLVDSADLAIVSVTLDGLVTSWNAGAQTVFGYCAEEMHGLPFTSLVTPGRENHLFGNLARLRLGERIADFDTIKRRKDGRDVDVTITTSPIRDRTGALTGASVVARDITQRKRAEAALSVAKDLAENTSREFEAFSYSVAHDLRAPLRAIDGFSQILLEDHSTNLDPEGRLYLDQVRQSTQFMGRLIDGLLTLARLSRRELDVGIVDLSARARDAVSRLRTLDPNREITVAIADNLLVLGDDALLGIVLENLMGNAWKFTRNTPNARIDFGQYSHSASADTERTFYVRDNGIGFDMAYSAKLFTAFQRLHSATEYEGTGIGLATISRIIQRHGGRIWARSTVGNGATFSFTISRPIVETTTSPVGR